MDLMYYGKWAILIVLGLFLCVFSAWNVRKKIEIQQRINAASERNIPEIVLPV